jgi:hypothetical protein
MLFYLLQAQYTLNIFAPSGTKVHEIVSQSGADGRAGSANAPEADIQMFDEARVKEATVATAVRKPAGPSVSEMQRLHLLGFPPAVCMLLP